MIKYHKSVTILVYLFIFLAPYDCMFLREQYMNTHGEGAMITRSSATFLCLTVMYFFYSLFESGDLLSES